MKITTTTNIRVGPGIYSALKEVSEKSGLNMGTCADLMVFSTLYNIDKNLSSFSSDTQKALIADMLAVLSEVFKLASLEAIKNTSFAEMYQTLLSQPKRKSNQAT